MSTRRKDEDGDPKRLSFRFDRHDAYGTFSSLADLVTEAAAEGRTDDIRTLNSVALGCERFFRLIERHRPKPVEPPAPDTPSASPLELRPAQKPPEGDWRTWLFLGGRGAGKTLAGANWLADQAEKLGHGGRLALIGPTLHDVREVMIEGVSGLKNLPRWGEGERPTFEASHRKLTFPGGCVAYAFSAEDPDSLRGPQFSGAWADEFCAWPSVGARGAGETLATLRMGLRLSGVDGAPPRLVVTTTPRPSRALKGLKAEPACVLTQSATRDNAEHLSDGFLSGLESLYGGTRRAAQELEGQIVELDGALFTAEMMARARSPSPSWGGTAERRESRVGSDSSTAAHPDAPHEGEGKLTRVIVAIDPTTTAGGDACGIVVAGSRLRPDGRREAVVLADRSCRGLSPDRWARRAIAAAREFGAGAVVVEVNQGGEMVESVLKTAGCHVRVRTVRATRGKRLRAEPVAALYEQGRVLHAGRFPELEEELMALGGDEEGSLDRADALVWAVTDLILTGPDGERGPRITWL